MNSTSELRLCSKCGISKELSGFYKNKGYEIGHSRICISCEKEYKRSRKYLDGKKKVDEKYITRNRHKKNAWNVFIKGLYHGDVSEKDLCERCSSRVRIEAHHPDYSKPLDVIYLCKKCHVKEHARLRALSL